MRTPALFISYFLLAVFPWKSLIAQTDANHLHIVLGQLEKPSALESVLGLDSINAANPSVSPSFWLEAARRLAGNGQSGLAQICLDRAKKTGDVDWGLDFFIERAKAQMDSLQKNKWAKSLSLWPKYQTKSLWFYEQSEKSNDYTSSKSVPIGWLAEISHNPEKSFGFADLAIHENPQDYFAWFRLGLNLELLGNPSSAADAWERCLRINPQYAPALLSMNYALQKAGKWKKAWKNIQTLRDLLPFDPEVVFNYHTIALQTNQREEAFQSAGDLILLYPEAFEPRLLMAETQAFYSLNSEAILTIDQVLLMNPGLAEAYVIRAYCYLNSGDSQKALNDFSMSLDLNPQSGEAYYGLGLAQIRTGQESQACSSFRKAIDRGAKIPDKLLRGCEK